MPINDKDLKEQAELTERLGRHANYQLKAQPGRKVQVRNKDNYKKVSSYVTREGRITFSKPGQAVDAMKSLGITISFRLTNSLPYPSDLAGSSDVGTDGCPKNSYNVGVRPSFEIHSSDPTTRKESRIKLRKTLWHEMIEPALNAVNAKVFGNPEGVRGLVRFAFADQYAKKIKSSMYDYSFWPWAGDAAPPQDKKTQKAKPVQWKVSDCCPGEIFITYESFPKGLKARILDYRFRLVKELSGSPGNGSIAFPSNLEPGTYWVDVNDGSRITRREMKVLLKKSILWELTFKAGTSRLQHCFEIRPASGSQWVLGKGLGFSLWHRFKDTRSGREEDREIGCIDVRSSRTETLILKVTKSTEAPLDPAENYTVWAYVKDPYLDDLLVDDHGAARAGVYIRWARHYIAKK